MGYENLTTEIMAESNGMDRMYTIKVTDDFGVLSSSVSSTVSVVKIF